MDNGHSTKEQLKEHYAAQADKLSAGIYTLKKKGRMYVTLELITFAMAVAAAVAYCAYGMRWPYLAAAAAMLAAYAAVRACDVRNGRRTDRLSRLHAVYIKEGRYMEGDYSCFGGGSRYIDPSHAFTFDMDVFGHESLFNRINRSVTTGGSDMLASWLANLPKDKAETERRRQAVDELAGMEQWRTGFMAEGQGTADSANGKHREIDTAAILDAVSRVSGMDIAPKAGRTWTLGVAIAALAAFALLIILSVIGILPATAAMLWGVIQMFMVIGLNARSIRNISRAVEQLHANLRTYISLIRRIGEAEFTCTELKELQHRLSDGGDGATESFGKLSGILDSLDRRGNFIGLILFNMFALSDYFLVRRFIKWQRLYMHSITEWTDCVSRVDALVSMGTFRFNEPKATEAEITEADGVEFNARGLYHPFLGDKAVRNDFDISDGHYYIITGANMAGKSTFLRSIGVNYILAMNGMPVFADSLRVSVFNLFSSMRTSDDLSRGISYFNAELLRLKQLLDNCRRASRTLIILDEILKGTNSLDKLNGSRLFLKAVAKMPVTGIIATHDLELSKMETEEPGWFHNWCFEIELADNITYTYKITPGVARNQNATFLLKNILNDA